MKKLLYPPVVLVICVLILSCSSPAAIPAPNPAHPTKTGSGLDSGAVIELPVIDGADDASENAREALVVNKELKVSSYPGATPWQRSSTGLIFRGVNIPRWDTLVASYISIYPIDSDANDINCNIYVEYAGNAEDFIANPHIINKAYRPRTTHYTSWVEDDLDIDTYINSPSLNAPLQELFSKADWTAGNDLAVLLIANENIEKCIRFWHQEKWLDLPVKLYVEYAH
jgi:hypothetical protein